MERPQILVVDDDPNIRALLEQILEEEEYEVDLAKNGKEAEEKIKNNVYSVILADVKMPGMSGLELLEVKNKVCPGTSFIIITAYGSIKSAVDAVKKGAFDYITKPFEPEDIVRIVKLAIKESKIFVKTPSYIENFIGKSKIAERILEQVKIAAESDVTVLLTGESGTGKSMVAEIIHNLSKRKDKPFIKINCSAIPETLIEAELFGFEKGAFTGAVRKKPGKFEIADGGTVFLDEIGDASPQMQAKLLHIIEEKEIEILGGVKPKKIDVRFIAATNKNLKKLMEEGSFRKDLYYRLNVFQIYLPPLKERKDDIPLLVEHFINYFNQKQNKRIKGVKSEVMHLFFRYPWYGNIRELKNVIERAVVLCDNEQISVEHLSEELKEFNQHPEAETELERVEVSEDEKIKILKVLEKTRWNKTKAAKLLGLTRNQLRYRLKKLGIE
ncbi:MAG: sigma-54-dependent Fis family transcriptional regulator [Thermodesulfobacteria bacterium]|nr:sigma-54-dependent Fis family transcriptional regulator [Thermodesulfobacteriota bacterium]